MRKLVEAMYEHMRSRKLRFHPRKVCGSVCGRGLLRQWEPRRKKDSIQMTYRIAGSKGDPFDDLDSMVHHGTTIVYRFSVCTLNSHWMYGMYGSFLQQSAFIACHLLAADQTRSFVEENSEDLQRAQVPFNGLVWHVVVGPALCQS